MEEVCKHYEAHMIIKSFRFYRPAKKYHESLLDRQFIIKQREDSLCREALLEDEGVYCIEQRGAYCYQSEMKWKHDKGRERD